MRFAWVLPTGKQHLPLTVSITAALQARRHDLVPWSDADVVFLDLHAACFPFEPGLLTALLARRSRLVVFEWCDKEFAWSGDDDWRAAERSSFRGQAWIPFLRAANAAGLIVAHFVRGYRGDYAYPATVHPIGEVLVHQEPVADYATFVARPHDIVYIGNRSVCRERIGGALQASGLFRMDVRFVTDRIPGPEWFSAMRAGRWFLEADGGGYGSARPYELCTIAAMLRQRCPRVVVGDWLPQAECIEIGDADGEVTAAELGALQRLLCDHERAYAIYLAGAAKLTTVFTAAARAERVVAVVLAAL